VLLANLRSHPAFPSEPADRVEKVEVSSLEFYPVGGGFARFELRGDDETIYQFLERQFGGQSPIHAAGWTIKGATLRIMQTRQDLDSDLAQSQHHNHSQQDRSRAPIRYEPAGSLETDRATP
jgi:hypothetical protein